MLPCGPMMKDLFDILSAHGDEEMRNRIWQQVNYQYFELAREVSWKALRADPVTLDFSTADTTGLFLPSDLYGIDLVWDADDKIEFTEKDRDAAQLQEWGYRFWRYSPSRAHLFEGEDVVVSKGAASFTSATLTAAGTSPNAQYVQFDDELGFYLVSSATTPFTFTPTYYGENKRQKFFKVRPWETTQKLVIIDQNEDELLDRDVKVYYWRAPTPLYRFSDVVMLPSVEVLKLRTLRALPESKGKFNVSQSMLDRAFKRAVKNNPRFTRVISPLDKQNKKFDMAVNPFGDRSQTTGRWPTILR